MQLVNPDGTETPPGEVGEIVIRGHNVMKGYWKRPEATEAAIIDGWFHTGDMATRDDDGFYFIVDRKKDIIIRGGYNVYPREIEEVLYEHPAVREAAVIGIPHPTHGEEVAAAVALRPRTSADSRPTPRLRQNPGCRLQVPATCVVCRCSPQGSHRQDPQTRNPSSHRASRSASGRGQYIDCLSCPRRPQRRQAKQLVEPTTSGAHMAERTERATVGRLELAYETFGDIDNPPLLLIAGLATQMLGWDEQFCMQLADNGFRVIRFDNRDIGLSTHLHDADVPNIRALLLGGTRSSAPYTLVDMADDTAGLIDALGLESAHVVGMSMGGMIAQQLAISHHTAFEA